MALLIAIVLQARWQRQKGPRLGDPEDRGDFLRAWAVAGYERLMSAPIDPRDW